MPTSRTTATVSRRTTLAGLGAGGLALALASSARPAPAPDAVTDLSTHPLTGTWLVIGNQSTPTEQLALPSHFLADGTVLVVTPPSQVGAQGVVFQSALAGRWEAAGERRGHFTAVQMLSDATGAFLGSVTLEGSPVVSEDGQTFIDDGSTVMATIRDPLGNVTQELPGAGTPPTTATRMGPEDSGFPASEAATPTS